MQSVGEILKAAREKKNLSVKDIESGTSIRSLYITAIEEDNYKIVPGEVYLKGFIRNYANYLGLDGNQIVELYRQGQQPAVDQVPFEQRIKQDRNKNHEPKKESSKGKYMVAGLIILAAIGATVMFTPGEKEKAQQPVPIQSSPATPAPQPQKAAAPNANTTAQTSPVVVKAKFSEECWTLVTADGKEIYEGVPKVGESFTWEAKNNIVVKVGNAGGIDLVYNGQAVGKLGAKGEVVERTFSVKS